MKQWIVNYKITCAIIFIFNSRLPIKHYTYTNAIEKLDRARIDWDYMAINVIPTAPLFSYNEYN